MALNIKTMYHKKQYIYINVVLWSYISLLCNGTDGIFLTCDVLLFPVML